MTIKANRIERYYDAHPDEVEGEDLSQTFFHFAALQYLLAVLRWMYRDEDVEAVSEINLYVTARPQETPVSPDVTIIDGLQIEQRSDAESRSYYVGEDGPPPRVAFEVASEETWRHDLEQKPARYEKLGVREFFAFDPNQRSFWKGSWAGQGRLLGWRLDPATGHYESLPKDAEGSLWSEELQSFVEMQGRYLRVYTPSGQVRPTDSEGPQQQADFEREAREQAEKEAKQERQQQQAEKRRAERALKQAVQALKQAEQARLEAEASLQQVQAERLRNERLAAETRRLGGNPDDLL